LIQDLTLQAGQTDVVGTASSAIAAFGKNQQTIHD
jgi:hypothetical protein